MKQQPRNFRSCGGVTSVRTNVCNIHSRFPMSVFHEAQRQRTIIEVHLSEAYLGMMLNLCLSLISFAGTFRYTWLIFTLKQSRSFIYHYQSSPQSCPASKLFFLFFINTVDQIDHMFFKISPLFMNEKGFREVGASQGFFFVCLFVVFLFFQSSSCQNVSFYFIHRILAEY